jgi:hypothetical protein
VELHRGQREHPERARSGHEREPEISGSSRRLTRSRSARGWSERRARGLGQHRFPSRLAPAFIRPAPSGPGGRGAPGGDTSLSPMSRQRLPCPPGMQYRCDEARSRGGHS